MKRWKDRWAALLPYEKWFEIAYIVCLGLALLVFAFEILGVSGIIPVDFDFDILFYVLSAIGVGCAAVSYWRRDRSNAVGMIVMSAWFGLRTVWEIVKLFI